MADTRKITIELITGSGKEEDKPKTPEEEEREKKEKQRKKFIAYAKKSAKQLANHAVNSGLDRYFSLTEDYASQNDFQVIKNTIMGAHSLVTSIGVATATMGPVGGIATAVVWAAEKVISTRSGYSEIARGLNANSYEMHFQSTRMSLVDNGRGTEN